jgi:hypothetical protein
MRGEKIMPSTQNAVNNHEYRSVPITALAESASLLVNFGKWSRSMLLAEPARLFGGQVFEVQGFYAVFCLRAEKIIARCEERHN